MEEMQKPKIELYVRRSFGEKFSATFDFIKENRKPLLKYLIYLLLPVSLIQALGLNGLMGYSMALASTIGGNATPSDIDILMSSLSSYALYALPALIGSFLMGSLLYALIRIYNEREERLQGITWGILKSTLFRNVKRSLILFLSMMLLTMLVGFAFGVLAAGISPYMLFLIIPLLIACIIPLFLWMPIYLFEDIPVWKALKKTFRLGFATWGGIFLILLIMIIISSILQGVLSMPWYVVTVVKYMFVSSGGTETTASVGFGFVSYLLAVVQVFGAYLASVFVYIGLAYQYGHASEKVDNIRVESDIDNFDRL